MLPLTLLIANVIMNVDNKIPIPKNPFVRLFANNTNSLIPVIFVGYSNTDVILNLVSNPPYEIYYHKQDYYVYNY